MSPITRAKLARSMGSEAPARARLIAGVVAERLSEYPIVVLSGARQVGKTTLVQSFAGAAERTYVGLDHVPTLHRASSAPEALVADAERMTIDEVQRVPDVLLAVQQVVDRRRSPGQFLLTGSANLLLLKTVGESLAGRAHHATLRPLTEREKRGGLDPLVWSSLMTAANAREALALVPQPRTWNWRVAAVEGGFPPAALATSPDVRHRWLENYAHTYLQQDLRNLAQIDDLAGFGRLMTLVALRTGGLLKQSDLARDATLPRTTTQRWLSVLEATYLMTLVQPFFESRSKRLLKAPKVYPGDTGLALHLAGAQDEAWIERLPNPGVWLEALVLNDLLAWREIEPRRPNVFHYRTTTSEEIDFVVEQGPRLLPVEIKSTQGARVEHARALDAFCREFADRAPFGIVVYDGRESMALTERVLAVPLGSLL